MRLDIVGVGTVWFDDVSIKRTDGQSEIIATNDYYPFGMQHEGNIIILPDNLAAQRIKYNGKELQDELGLGIYDYGARNYDPAIGRWFNIDPKAEVSRRWSTYTYCYNNPMRFVDPDGRQGEDYVKINHLTKQAEFVRTNDSQDYVTITGSYGTTSGTTDKGVYNADNLRGAGYEVKELYAVGSSVSDKALATFGLGKIISGLYNLVTSFGSSNTTSTASGGRPMKNESISPDRTAQDPLRRNPDGTPKPDSEAQGTSHTQLGTKDGRKGEYKQAREFTEKDEPVRDVDFTDHGRPQNHPNPHQHQYTPNPTGGTPQRSNTAEPLQ